MPANGTQGKQQDAAHSSAAHTIAAEMLDLLVGKSPLKANISTPNRSWDFRSALKIGTPMTSKCSKGANVRSTFIDQRKLVLVNNAGTTSEKECMKAWLCLKFTMNRCSFLFLRQPRSYCKSRC